MKVRILAFVLSCLMVLSAFPVVGAFAAVEDTKCSVTGAVHTAADGTKVTGDGKSKAPTCTEYGYDTYKCSHCGEFYAVVVNRLSTDGKHKWVDVAHVNDTCDTVGNTKGVKCSTCGQTAISASEGDKGNYASLTVDNNKKHNWVVSKTEVNGCNVGTVTYKCSNTWVDASGKTVTCSATKKEAATPSHAWAQYPTTLVNPTCTTEGVATYKCTRSGCSATTTVRIAKTHGALISHAAEPAADCTGVGVKAYWECSVCGRKSLSDKEFDKYVITSNDELLEQGPHTKPVNGPVVSTNGNCTTDATEAFHCTVCDQDVVVVSKKATGHVKANYHAKTEQTCTQWGVEYIPCAVCGTMVEELERKPPLGHIDYNYAGHKYEAEKGTTAADCTTPATAWYKCTRCGEKQTTNVGATLGGHVLASKTVAATCGNYGYTVTYCTRKECKLATVTSTSYVDIKGATQTVDLVALTGVAGGVKLVNFAVNTRLDPTNHEVDTTTGVFNPPTCTTDGNKVGKCKTPGCNGLVVTVTAAQDPSLKATGHTWDSKDAAWDNTAADKRVSCTKAGILTHTCVNCGAKQNINYPAMGHNLSKDIIPGSTVAPSCKGDGYSLKTCSNGKFCSEANCQVKVDIKKFVEPTGYYKDHDAALVAHPGIAESENVTFIDPGKNYCTNALVKRTVCTDCGKQILFVGKVQAEDGEWYVTGTHAFVAVNGEVDVAPTCTTPGRVAAAKCARCGAESAGKDIPALGHSMKWEVAPVAPTCTTDGLTGIGKCTRPGCTEAFTKIEVVPKLDHKRNGVDAVKKDSAVAAVAATCTTAGTTASWICDICGAKIGGTTVKPLGHAYVTSPNETANGKSRSQYYSCTDAGFDFHECTRCHDQYIDNLKTPLGQHEFLYVPEVTNPTCEKNGSRTFHCIKCTGGRLVETIPATGHKNAAGVVFYNICNDKTADRICTNPNCDYASNGFKVPTEHGWNNVTVPPTCTEDGYVIQVCYACSIPYTENGVVVRVNSGASATGHKEGNWTTVRAATATTDGLKQTNCTKCGAVMTAVIPKGTNGDLTFVVTHKNAVVGNAKLSDTSLVKVTVAVKSNKPVNDTTKGTEAWGIGFTMDYDPNVFEFVGVDSSSVFTSNVNANANVQTATWDKVIGQDADGKDIIQKIEYKLSASLSYTATAKGVNNVTVNDKDNAVVTLLFKVVTAETTGINTTFAIKSTDVITKDGATVQVSANSASTTVTLEKFMQLTGDANITLVDVLELVKIMTGDAKNGDAAGSNYRDAADLNKDGSIDGQDLELILAYYSKGITYWQLVGREAPVERPAATPAP